MELHVACFVADGGVGVSMGVIHEHLGLGVGSFSGMSLLGGDFIDGRKHAWVDAACIVKECSIDRLDALGARGM